MERDLSPGSITDLSHVAEGGQSAVSWGAVIAGAVAALALSFVLLALAGGFGLQVTTQKVPLSARVFHPSGFSLGVRGTFVDQSGDFQRNGTCCQSGSSKFWVFDAGISYRLPDRRGFVFVGATNIFNRNFLYQETDFNNPTFVPGRAAVAIISLALP